MGLLAHMGHPGRAVGRLELGVVRGVEYRPAGLPCPKCGGSMLPLGGELECLQCGAEPRSELPDSIALSRHQGRHRRRRPMHGGVSL